MPTVLKSRLLRAPTAWQVLGAHTFVGPLGGTRYPGSGDKGGLRSGESLYSEEAEGIRANRQERGWESCSRLLPPVWAGPGWMAKLVVATGSGQASGQGQTLPQSRDAAVPEGRGPVCGRDSELTPPPTSSLHYQGSSSSRLLLTSPHPPALVRPQQLPHQLMKTKDQATLDSGSEPAFVLMKRTPW